MDDRRLDEVGVREHEAEVVEATTSRRTALLGVALRHPFLTTFLVALVARATAALLIWAFLDGSIYEDDLFYTRMAIQSARGETHQWDDYTYWLYERTGTMMVPLTALYEVAGTSTLPGQLAIAAVGASVAATGARLFRTFGGRCGTLTAGLVIALLPSQIVLSSVALKDAPVWMILIGLSLLLAALDKEGRARELLVPAGVVILLVLLSFLRQHTTVAAAVAVAITAVLLCRRRTTTRTIGVLSAAVLTPVLLGLGPLGLSFVNEHSASVDVIRSSNARGDGAIAAATTTTAAVASTPTAAPGPTVAPRPSVDDGGAASLRYLPRGLLALLLEPFPWRAGNTNQRLAAVETVIWYPLLGLAAVGLVQAFRQRIHQLLFPVVIGTGTLLMWSLIEGNIGTAYRHRGEFAWVVCLLAVLGGVHLNEHRRRMRERA